MAFGLAGKYVLVIQISYDNAVRRVCFCCMNEISIVNRSPAKLNMIKDNNFFANE